MRVFGVFLKVFIEDAGASAAILKMHRYIMSLAAASLGLAQPTAQQAIKFGLIAGD